MGGIGIGIGAVVVVVLAALWSLFEWIREMLGPIICVVIGLATLFSLHLSTSEVGKEGGLSNLLYFSTRILSTVALMGFILTLVDIDMKLGYMPFILIVIYIALSLIFDYGICESKSAAIVVSILLIVNSLFMLGWVNGADYAERLQVNTNVAYIEPKYPTYAGQCYYEKDNSYHCYISKDIKFPSKERIYVDFLDMSDEEKWDIAIRAKGDTQIDRKEALRDLCNPVIYNGDFMFMASDLKNRDKAFSINSEYANKEVFWNKNLFRKRLCVKLFSWIHPGIEPGQFVME